MKAMTVAISQPLHTNAMTKDLPGIDASRPQRRGKS
jgi:hypothetical protein